MPEVASSGGFRIGYESFGRGLAVLLLHPANATREAWSYLGWAEALTSAGHRVVTVDSRGFGGSDRVSSPGQLAPGTSSLDISAVMDALEIDSAHLCGFSLGAAQALRFVLDQPPRVRSLVLGGLAVGPLAQMGLHLSASAEAARTEALVQVLRPLEKASGEARAYFLAVQGLLSATPLLPITPSNLRVPILGVSGAADPYDPPALYRTLSSGGARIEISSIPGVGHGTCFTHPNFRKLATQFVVAQAGRRTSGCS
jgi:pimeloyl-ACP methyl ester carboxylesterase